MASNTLKVAPVDSYKERPLDKAVRTVEDHVLAEGRADREDQIPDYHEKNPTLDPDSSPSQVEIDKAVTASARTTPKAKAVKDAVDEVTL